MSSSRPPSEQDAAKPQSNGFLSNLSFSKLQIKLPLSSYFDLYRPLKTWHERLTFYLAIILALAAGAPLPIIGVIFSRIINTFPPNAEDTKKHIIQLIGVAIAYFAVTWGWAVCWGMTGERVSRGLREEMVDRALGMDQTYYETKCPDITSRLTADAQVVQSGTSEKVGLFLQSISYFIVAFAVGFWLNARLTGILFAGVIPSMACVVYIGTMYVNRYSKQATECTTLASAIAEGAIKAVQVVQAFGAAETLNEEHAKHLNEALKQGVKKATAGALLLGGIFFVAFSANALAFWEGSRLSEGSSSGAGTIYAIVFLVLDASFVVGQFGPFIQSFALAASAGGRILDLIDYPPQPIDVYSEKGIKVDKNTFRSDISFEKVSFSYPARPTESVLKSVSFNLKSGKTIGVVGSSGSGKSTIAGLLLRLYDTESGRVLLDNHSISQFNLASLRTQIALVDQDPAVFSGTVLSNIRQGIKSLGPLSEEETRERCIAAAKESDAWSFIQNLPDGIDSRLGEPDGTKLSGGQKQRLCLARALVDDPSLLILDEATSALDTISEAAIMKSLSQSRHKSNRTTIMIAHRLATVKDADDIIVMGHGQVLEQGSHSELIAKEDGAYRSLLEAQRLTDVENDPKAIKNVIEAEIDGREDHTLKTLDPFSDSSKDVEASKPSKEQSALGHVVRRCLSLTKDKWYLTIIALFATTTTGCLVIGESLVFGNLVSILNNAPVDESRVNFFCLMFFILALIALGAYVLAGTCFGIVSEYLIFRTRDLSLRTILKQDAEWFLQPNHSTTALTAVLSMDSSHLSGLSGVILGTVFTALASIIGGAILAHIVAWKIAIVLFATSPIIVCAGFFRLSVIAKVEERNQKSYTQAASLAAEACSAIRTVAALGAEKDIATRFKTAVRSQGKKNLVPTIFGNLLLAIALAITYFIYALAYYWGSKLVRENEYSTLQFFIVLPAILFSAQASGQMFSLAPEVGRARAAASRVFALHDERPTIDISETIHDDGKVKDLGSASNTTSSSTLVIPCPTSPEPKTELDFFPQSQSSTAVQSPTSTADQIRDLNLPDEDHLQLKGKIEFRNVSLTYTTRPDKPIFSNLSFTIPAGQTVAFVGTSGAGKSSAINLIERFYDPTSGTILIDDIDIKSRPVDDHRARLSLVAQEPGLFAGTVAFNVGLGLEATAKKESEKEKMERIEEACKACGIHAFVTSLPDGYGTQCGLNGSQLSGGQKQRLAIARACIRDPEVLLLDEATSALDSHSEQQVQAAISSASSKRTTIMIAHRLTTVQTADRIMVFDSGRIVGDGTHRELFNQGGVYAEMVGMQILG